MTVILPPIRPGIRRAFWVSLSFSGKIGVSHSSFCQEKVSKKLEFSSSKQKENLEFGYAFIKVCDPSCYRLVCFPVGFLLLFGWSNRLGFYHLLAFLGHYSQKEKESID